MDFFDIIFGNLIPILIAFVILSNLLQVIFGKKEQDDTNYDDEQIDYEETEQEPEMSSVEEEQRKILEEFERVLKQPKPPIEVEGELARRDVPQKTEQKILKDEELQVIHRDGEDLQHDNKSKIYTEKPLIEEEEIKHVTAIKENAEKKNHLAYPNLANAVKWAEILGSPKGLV